MKIDTFIREQNDTLPPSELYTAYLNTNADMEENDKLKKLFKNRVYLHKKKIAAKDGKGDKGDEVEGGEVREKEVVRADWEEGGDAADAAATAEVVCS